MQKKTKQKLAILIFLMVILVLPLVSASFFNWVKKITGKVTGETESIQERVICGFTDSNSEQKCYTNDGMFACSGTGTCTIDVKGEKGKTLIWKSSCGSEIFTTIDGVDDSIEFKCQTTQTPATTSQTAESTVKEQVKCVFANSDSVQKCYTEDGRFGCAGTGTCTADVIGTKETKLSWKTSCADKTITTLIDGNNENIGFSCQQTLPTTPVANMPTTELVKEQVKCIFANSQSAQACYSEKGSCKGAGTCVVDISGEKGKMLTWKSSCGSYAYTVIDGNNEYAEFNCQQITTSTPMLAPMQTQPIPSSSPTQTCTDSDGLNYYSKGYVESNGRRDFDTCRVINSNTDYYDTSDCGGPNCWVLEAGCTKEETAYSQVWKCPSNTCKDGACVPEPGSTPGIREQVRCIFLNSDVLINPHTARPEECYSDYGNGCKWTGTVVNEENGKKYAMCVVDVSGEQGKKITWKSSCGSYAYTVIDGNNEDAEFKCVPSSSVSKEQIIGKGFKYASWQCYDGKQAVKTLSDISCESAEVFQQEANEFCKDHCYKDESASITKCGVNSFSVSKECYINVEDEKAFTHFVKSKGKKIAMPPYSKEGDIILVYFYNDACYYCKGMDKELEKVSKESAINFMKVNIDTDSELTESYSIVGVPSLVLLEYHTNGIKEYSRTGKTDYSTILNWINSVKSGANILPEKPKEEILICKDSCPLEKKCYPFGYRKAEKFCSDEGIFKEQLTGEVLCENNFECETNVCIDGKCISSGLIQKVMNWFKRLFG